MTAIDLLEQLTKDNILTAFDHVAAAVAPNGVFVARVPNVVSPFGGNIRYGDFAPESWYTDRSDRQLAAENGSLCGTSVTQSLTFSAQDLTRLQSYCLDTQI